MKNNKIINNAKWIILCRAVQSLIQLVIGMISARYLGPANYGLIGYASSVVGFALPIMQLGLNSTLVQELIETPEQEGKIMGTALVMDLVSGLGCMLLVGAFVSIANRGETETIIVCILYSTLLIFQAMEVMQCWFQYELASKYPSIVSLCAYVVVSAYKIYVLAAAKSVYWFAVVNAIDYAIIGIALICIYKKLNAQKLSFSFQMAKRLIVRGKYYIMASMMVTVFQNTDHIMLKMMYGDAENGFYTAAVTCTAICQFVYTATVESFQPEILAYKKKDAIGYEKRVIKLYSLIIYVALIQGIGSAVFAKYIVLVLYGLDYLKTVPILQILVWQVSFSYMGVVRNVWILAEGKEKIIWKLNLAGAVLNASANVILIPRFSACGAAFASLMTQIFTNFVLGFFVKELKKNNQMILKSLNPRVLFETLGK